MNNQKDINYTRANSSSILSLGKEIKSRDTSLWILGFIIIGLLFPSIMNAQIVKGVVVDSLSGKRLSYVHIGVEGKNVGTISDDKGVFQIDLSEVKVDEKVSFSMIAYKTAALAKSKIKERFVEVKLVPQQYELEEIEVVANEGKKIKLGRYKNTKTTMGQGGINEFGFGGEWGIEIKHPGKAFYLKDVNFHTRFNTVDSVLFRVNVYDVKSGKPGVSKLKKEVFTKSYAKDKWISANLLQHNLLIEEDIIVSFEIIRIWYRKKGKNFLFFSYGKGYEEGASYFKGSSFDTWKTNSAATLAIYITGIEL